MKNKTFGIVLIILMLVLILVLLWATHIVPLQLDFMKQCELDCREKEMDYDTRFSSRPWSEVNGLCYCMDYQYHDLEVTYSTENKKEVGK